MASLDYLDTFHNNLIIILDAIPDGEITAHRLNQDLQDCFNEIGEISYCNYERVKTADEFRGVLLGLIAYAKDGVFPVLHIEAHGVKGAGLKVGGDIITWRELYDFCLLINIEAKNNFGLVLSSCYGSELSKLVSIDQPCPFRFVIGHQNEVRAGLLRDQMKLFYSEIIRSQRLDFALEHLDDGFVWFLCSRYFLENVAAFFRKNSAGKPAKTIREEALTKFLDGRLNNRHTRKIGRKKIKELLESPEWFVTQYMKNFLHGQVPVAYEQLRAFYLNIPS